MLQQSKHGLLCPKTGEIPAQGGTVKPSTWLYSWR